MGRALDGGIRPPALTFPDVLAGLDDKLRSWTERGLITAEQADAIRATEKSPGRGRASYVTEILGYLGGILATVALLMLMSDVWEELTPPAQIAALLFATAALVLAGVALRRNEQAAIERLAGFLWLAAVATYAGGVFLVGTEIVHLGDERPMGIFTGLVASTLAVPLWLARRKMLQQTALFGALATVSVFVPPEWASDAAGGWSLAAFGLLWFVAAQIGVLEPARTGDALGIGALYFGLQFIAFDEDALLGVAVLVMAIVVVIGVARDRNAALAASAAALVILVPQFITELFGPNLGATAAMAVVGLMIVAIAMFVGRRRAAD